MSINLGIKCTLSNGANSPSVSFDISKYVLKASINRSKQRLLQRFDAGTMTLTLDNRDRRFEPLYAPSPYYPYIMPMMNIQLSFVLNGVTYPVYTGFVISWPQVYQGPTWAEVDIDCVDAFEVLSNMYLTSSYATLTTSLGSNRDLVYTSTPIGFVGNSTTVTYVVSGLNTPLSVTTSGTQLIVNLATDASGVATSTANAVLAAVNAAGTPVQALVQTTGYPSPVALAPGSDGTGVLTAMAATNLSGGTFTQQTSGAYITAIINSINTKTNNSSKSLSTSMITTGQTLVQAQSFNSSISGSGSSTPAIDQIQLATQTEDGQFFIDTKGNPTFLDRTTLASGNYSHPVIYLTDYPNNVTTFGYQNIKIDYDRDLIYNDIRGTRLNGTNVTSASDSTSISNYFDRTLSLDGVLNVSDNDALNLAENLLLKYKNPIIRYEPLVLLPGNNSTFWQTLLSIDLINAVSVSRTPPAGGQPISNIVQIIGISIEIPQGPMTNTKWTLSIDPTSSYTRSFILDDTTYGTLDFNSLGY